MATTYGYIRVSTADQNEVRQIDAMALAGVDRANVVIGKQSGKDFNRPGWKRLKRKIRMRLNFDRANKKALNLLFSPPRRRAADLLYYSHRAKRVIAKSDP